MKNALVFGLAIFAVSPAASADQEATLTCTGSRIILTVKSPYLGENSKATQKLYVLKSIDMNRDEATNTAYFLDVEEDIGGARHGGAGTLVFTGRNEVGGKFQMFIAPWSDESSETTFRQTSLGKISYSHGPLKGKNEPVRCVLE